MDENLNFSIELRSDKFDENSKYWQDQCYDLYKMLKTELPSGSIRPLSLKAEKGKKAELITIFTTLIVSGIAERAIDKIIDKLITIIKLWEDNKPKTRIVLNYPDGSKIELSNLSVVDAKKIMQEHQKH